MDFKKIQLLAVVLNDFIEESDAIICLQGDGYVRADWSFSLFKMGISPRIVVSGGIKENPFVEDIANYLKNKGVEEVIVENQSNNTREQALNVIKLVKNNNWKKIILVASGFHQPRAFLTFLKAKDDANLDLKIFNSPVANLSWFKNTAWKKTRLELLEEEFKKIDEYMLKGHLATIDQGLNYQKWKEEI